MTQGPISYVTHQSRLGNEPLSSRCNHGCTRMCKRPEGSTCKRERGPITYADPITLCIFCFSFTQSQSYSIPIGCAMRSSPRYVRWQPTSQNRHSQSSGDKKKVRRHGHHFFYWFSRLSPNKPITQCECAAALFFFFFLRVVGLVDDNKLKKDVKRRDDALFGAALIGSFRSWRRLRSGLKWSGFSLSDRFVGVLV